MDIAISETFRTALETPRNSHSGVGDFAQPWRRHGTVIAILEISDRLVDSKTRSHRLLRFRELWTQTIWNGRSEFEDFGQPRTRHETPSGFFNFKSSGNAMERSSRIWIFWKA